MLVVSIVVVALAIALGARIGGIGVAFAAGAGLYILTMVLGLEPGVIPVNVVLIIMAVIGAIAVLELSGGLQYIVKIASRLLRSNPKQINILAPFVTFILTALVGTQHANYSVMPVIVEVAKKQGIKPVRPLTSAVVAGQVAVTASPVSAAVVALSVVMAPQGISFGTLGLILFPSALFACLLVGLLQKFFLPQDLNKDKNYLDLLASGHIKETKQENTEVEIPKTAIYGLIVFICSIALIVIYGIFSSLKPTYASGKQIDTALLIVILMFSAALIMLFVTKAKVNQLTNQATFKAGMSAALCVIGVAWLGDTLVANYKTDIMDFAGDFLKNHQWSLAIIFFFVSMLLYSQAATFLAISPIILALGLSPLTVIASFAATSALFVLPTYPTVIAATSMDYTGTTKLGQYVFNHPFILPGTLAVIFSVSFAYLIGSFVL